ncbi:MAG: alpha-glucuronidase [Clostridia bacterium]|nr:alpha-glucuronidase [Clostridia bacterium]
MRSSCSCAWLPFFNNTLSPEREDCLGFARDELALGLRGLGLSVPVSLNQTGDGEGFSIQADGEGWSVSGGEQGLLYGVYRLLIRLSGGLDPALPLTQPRFELRMINHWDNPSGLVERGYAGHSLFFSNGVFSYLPERVRLYARLLCSIGINTVCLNNVNVHTPADRFIMPEYLPELAKIASLFRPFGIRLLVAVDYSLPARFEPGTADPLDPAVQAWWKKTIDRVYQTIPDLRGFLIKADSESRPGPYLYGRDHAQGAKLLSVPLAKHGGILVWRCFVYNCKQDWRDTATDRPKAAYSNYTHLDGRFDANVILQIKYGPFDFQPREPLSPLLLAMPRTGKALEVQLAQEYTGQQIDLYYMPPQWEEMLADMKGANVRHICAVSNIGDDFNWTGHDLAQANLYAYGRMAWEGTACAARFGGEWIKLTYDLAMTEHDTLLDMLMDSREIYVQYTAPLGVCWMVTTQSHYGPQPEGYEYTAWGTYLRTTSDLLGTNRTETGTGFILQYPPAIQEKYADPAECDERLLLFFHRLPYTFRMRDGRTLIQRIYDDHFLGAARAGALTDRWMSLKGHIPEAVYAHALERFERQAANAREWRDIVNTYYFRYSRIQDERGRVIYE